MKPRLKLKNRIIKSFLLLVISIMTVVMIVVGTILITALNKGLTNTLSQQAINAAKNMEHRIVYLNQNIVNLSQNHFIINSLVHPKGSEDYLMKMMNDFGKLEDIRSLSLLDYSGKLVHSNIENVPKYKEIIYLRPVLEMGRPIIKLSPEKSQLLIIEPISHYNTPIGAVAAEVDLPDIINRFIPEDHNIYYRVYVNENLIYTFNFDESGSYIIINTHDRERSNQFKNPFIHIDIELGIKRSFYRSSLLHGILPILFLSAIFLFITVILASQIGNNIANPILKMVKKASLSDMDLTGKYSPVGTNDELEILAESLDIRESQLFEYRNNLQEKVNERTQELTQINKKLENYSYSISHDLKEPLRSIRSFSEFIHEDYSHLFDATAKDYCNRIMNASAKMSTMIDDLLTLSRVGREDIEYKATSVKALLNEVKDTFKLKTEEANVHLIIDEMPLIKVQATWLKALFQNLISNSIKYNDKEEKIIEISYQKNNNFYEFSVKDNGIGIPSEQHKKVFQLFRKVHQGKYIEGSGAGLAIASSVVTEHGGKIWVDWSEPGKGTKIKFTIKEIENQEF